ncbi:MULTISPECIES: DUF3365 domain-containing protein [unclassified Lentimonas]|uniref:Tll0287-like domain-containing protein n=1 Tax=unclassified Lentimonas TaxID=2630993 RepID=UPI00132ADBA0|nr:MULTISPECIES: DUF3365 domain-containing protein [unclassified Lentimonas]CAA6676994.1 Unannotated [Lentimonas sp. CC4]CAA6686800.1 Unannotated [Lentimonas sp. CC6]CAA7075622.1 Unannotated [Lentimonas sp. CC4]CAA7168220.1 Unannotated [Lentimonas sp. CC21]CAA7181629.1 Unannotated [Lentimonas sp. CC8]
MKQLGLLAGLSVATFMCGCSDHNTANDQAYIDRSEAIVSELKTSLGTQLKQAMQAGGPVNALQVCQQIAQPITQQVTGDHEGAQVSRTALRVRNSANQADTESTSIMESWEALLATGASSLPPAVSHDGDTITVHHPIMVGEACLKCHGDPASFSEELQTTLGELYPADQATGYELGQLRGAFRVEFSND